MNHLCALFRVALFFIIITLTTHTVNRREREMIQWTASAHFVVLHTVRNNITVLSWSVFACFEHTSNWKEISLSLSFKVFKGQYDKVRSTTTRLELAKEKFGSVALFFVVVHLSKLYDRMCKRNVRCILDVRCLQYVQR